MGMILAGFFARLCLTAAVLYGSLKYLNGTALALAAGIGLYMLTADGEAGAEVYAAAVTRDQAQICFQDAVKQCQSSPDLDSRIEYSGSKQVYNLAHFESGSFFRPLAITKSVALASAALLAIKLVPALCVLLIRGRMIAERRSWLVRSLIEVYQPLLLFSLQRPLPLFFLLAATLLR